MEKPYPGPHLLLPAIDLSRSPSLDSHLDFKRREALFKRQVSDLHKQWCLCGSYKNHFISPNYSLKKDSCSEDTGGDSGEGATGGAATIQEPGDIADEDILAGGDPE
ncbi:ORF2 [Torque teno ocelot virus]|uniref:ORF2 n=1 Tax=Torque teno ocelot virus TaxID=2579707 RepID=A0A4P8W9X6_9VIRU|nr:ORF2 [Torque teno ocelot virus]QCS38451.1 ORF2 [Torque teno ocelot virus]